MNSPTALIAHPHPIVVDSLAVLVTAAGYTVTRSGDVSAAAAGLATTPDLALIAPVLGGAAAVAARNGATQTLLISDGPAEGGVIALTDPVDRIAAQIAAIAGIRHPSTGPALTPRERDVARLVAAGQRNRGIAAALGISEGTVKMHLHNVYAKLGLQSRTQLAMSTRTGTGA